jgi:hypothetical protein
MSYTYTVHGLALTMAHMFDHFQAEPLAFPKNRRLSTLLIERAYEIAEDKPAKLRAICRAASDANLSSVEQQVERWIKSGKTSSVPKGRTLAPYLLMATVYNFKSAWAGKMGDQTDIRGYKAFGVKGQYYNKAKVAVVTMKNGDQLFFWYTRKRNGLDLYLESWDMVEDRMERSQPAEIILPYVDLRHSDSYGLDGWDITDLTSVDSCTFNNWFHMDKDGAAAKSVTRTRMLTKGRAPKPLRVVFDKPFAAAILEKRCVFPTMVAKCDKNVWQKR